MNPVILHYLMDRLEVGRDEARTLREGEEHELYRKCLNGKAHRDAPNTEISRSNYLAIYCIPGREIVKVHLYQETVFTYREEGRTERYRTTLDTFELDEYSYQDEVERMVRMVIP
jgi:hypothetical protein